MHTATSYVPFSDLGRQMATMRTWLDERHLEPCSFSCRTTREQLVVISVEFRAAQQAGAFADHFGSGSVSYRPY